MSENLPDDAQNTEEENFEDLLASYSQGMRDDINVGDKISAKVISIGSDTVYVDTGTKVDGVVEKNALLDENGELTVAKGDTLELYVVSMNENEMILSKAISGQGSIELLQDAYRTQTPVEGKIKEVCKGGFSVDILQKRAFCPISQVDIKYVKTPEDYVGKSFEFLITRLEDRGKNIVISRRLLLEKELEEVKQTFFKELKVGDVRQGRVTNIMPYGAFVELIPGIEGMVHISEISWSKMDKPEELLATGDAVTVKILKVIYGEKGEQPKISLTLKQLETDPWDTVHQTLKSGEIIKGKVTRLAQFGGFIELLPGVEGLVHLSEMSYTKRVVRADELIKPGDVVPVLIKEIDLTKKRISLSLRDAEGDPWADVEEKYPAGRVVEGTLEKKEKFGYFIRLEPGVTGLLPKAVMNRAEDPTRIERVKPGEPITVAIDQLRTDERKISLTLPNVEEGPNADWRSYQEKNAPASALGELGEKLQNALKSK